MYNKRLKELRESNNLDLQDLSTLLNFEKDTYGKYEREYIIIPIKHLNTLCNYFDVSIDYIFGFTNKTNYNNYQKEIDTKKVSNRLKEFRKDNNLTQEKLAKLLNVVKGTIGNYESARALIATPFLYTICKKYNISADYLLGKVDEPKYLK
jgi:transcriptional regulator with XRE-family HTH domain